MSAYSHDESLEWNNQIIACTINLLVESTNKDSILSKLKEQSRSYKYIIYVTLLDQLPSGPKGIRTSSGAYWNSEKDGLWNFKYEGKGVDAIVSIAWIHSTS